MDNVLTLPLSNDYIQNRLDRLCKELVESEVDYIDPLLLALIQHLASTREIDENEHIQDCYGLLYAALLSYRRFTGEINLRGIDDIWA